ncbi:MAG: phosphoribosylformylglycinamidine synthase subunit PurL [candidate division Zixibacteria bacterium]|nr:phosphoribosylformylglycinamidine synthase subunit PurL [candidate division Zixibacteria bacterium]
MKEPEVNIALAKKLGLTEEEYQKIQGFLGRMPTYTELGIYAVMWSEHCSYKNSIALLKTLPREGSALVAKAGEENAGAVVLDEERVIVFKIESHNHPSAVEPYQGAATGVGGILRDVFTMGARPIAALNSLRFGNLGDPRVRYLLDGVVRGISDYGNSFGVPTVAGEVYFEDCYTGNPLVNAMAVGLAKRGRLVRAIATGVGNPVFIVGSSTGRDGIHGASFASKEITDESEEDRPSVQIGDPFTEKLLLEASLEIIKKDLIVGMQDMGAAGLTCSTSEMAAKGKAGIEIDLDKVPLREKGMTPYEIMLSESQERMLVIGKKGREVEIREVFEKWDLNCVQIGEVTDTGRVVVKFLGRVAADIPAESLVLGGGAPVYNPPRKKPTYLENGVKSVKTPDPPKDLGKVLLDLLASPNIASKRWVFQQYDSTVRTNTVFGPGYDAALLRIRGSKKGIAVKTDCNARYCYLDPRRGAAIAVCEAARNVVAVGAKPMAITNCLNFGNPGDPEVYWTFAEAIAGMGEACRALETPVTGGNVSFYNEDPTRMVYPTPVIGMLGILDDIDKATSSHFQTEGNWVYLVGETKPETGGSEYMKVLTGQVAGVVPTLDLKTEKKIQAFVLNQISAGIMESCHDVSDGGLGVALAEMCIGNQERKFGFALEAKPTLRPDLFLFSESQSRFVVEIKPQLTYKLEEAVKKENIPLLKLGTVGGTEFMFSPHFHLSIEEFSNAYFNSIETKIG